MILENAQPGPSALERAWESWKPTGRYLMAVETHVYAFSMAANLLLSFFPFLIVMVSLCRYVLRWQAAEAAIFLALGEYFPDQLGDFLQRNLRATVASRGPFQAVSVVLLMYTANGIFEPLEVALNRAWGIRANRSYFKNQLISLLLILACGALALVSASVAALHQEMWEWLGGRAAAGVSLASYFVLKTALLPMSILLLTMVYWVLPNGRVPLWPNLPAAVVVGALLEVLSYGNIAMWPWLRVKLELEYGPFVYSATIILWGFLASMVVLAGAERTARGAGRSQGVYKQPEKSIDSRGN